MLRVGSAASARRLFSLLHHGRGSSAARPPTHQPGREPPIPMLNWILTFLVLALIAGVLGFSGITNFALDIAAVLFVIALVLIVVNALRGRGATVS